MGFQTQASKCSTYFTFSAQLKILVTFKNKSEQLLEIFIYE